MVVHNIDLLRADACRRAAKTLVVLGYANMGGINDLPMAIELIKRGKNEEIAKIVHAEILELCACMHAKVVV